MRTLHKLDAAAAGLLFACLQFCFFFLLESRLSSAWTAYAAVTLAWMLGTLAGLRLPLRGLKAEGTLLALQLGAYYALRALLRAHPFQDSLLPLAAAGVAVAGLGAGHFFAENAGRRPADRLLFWENNGFLGGMLLNLLWFFAHSGAHALWAPLACAGARTLLWAAGALPAARAGLSSES